MKLKQDPDDFQVEERTDVVPGEQGEFALYRLDKRGWTTPDALGVIRRRWDVHPRRLSFGGLKDRHAATSQYLTILHGPRRGLRQQNVELTYLGQVAEPYTSHQIRANFFRLVLRAVPEARVAPALAAAEEVREQGIPNYFDDQRFGSVSDGEFIARLMVLGRYEEALKLALAAPYEYDRAAQRKEKEVLRSHWGDWPRCKEALPRGHARSLVDYLCSHPTDFRGALERLRRELGGLYLSAYQSALWNRTLARFLAGMARPEQLLPVRLRLGDAPFHRHLDAGQLDRLATTTLPLASARLHLEPDDPRDELVRAVLREDGLELEQMKLKGIHSLFFSKGERAALCRPAGLTADSSPDDRHPGRFQLRLAFELPRGSYATLVVKRLQAS